MYPSLTAPLSRPCCLVAQEFFQGTMLAEAPLSLQQPSGNRQRGRELTMLLLKAKLSPGNQASFESFQGSLGRRGGLWLHCVGLL